jgi:predicted nucleic acid-binding protein
MSVVVSDASPLIALSAVSLLDLPSTLYGTIHIPEAVYEEVVVRGQGRPGSLEVAGAEWIIRHNVADQQAVAQLRNLSGLDEGESEAIILAGSSNASLIILDDRDARRMPK